MIERLRIIRRMFRADYVAPLEFGVVMGLGLAALAFALRQVNHGGGSDAYVYNYALASGCVECTPYFWYMMFFIFPLRWLDWSILWPIWVFGGVLAIFWAAKQTGTNGLLLLLTISGIGMLWLGQLDVFVLIGIALVVSSRSPWLRGLGFVLMTAKPYTGFAVLLLLWYEWKEFRDWRVLILPLGIVALSALVWGIDWPLRWLEVTQRLYAGQRAETPVWNLAARFPWGLASLGLLPFLHGKRDQLIGVLAMTALAVPSYGVYGYEAFLVLWMPWWALPLSWVWGAAAPLGLYPTMQFAGLLPLGILVGLVWPQARDTWKLIRGKGPTAAAGV